MFRQHFGERDVQVSSAGLGALKGHAMDQQSQRLLNENGIDAAGHSARQIDVGMLREADLVLVMERGHLAATRRLAPEASGKMFLLSKWLDDGDVPDPYRRSRKTFEHVYALIERGVQSWLRYL